MSVSVSPVARPGVKATDALSSARLLISCPDRPGIVAAVSQFLFEMGANIVRSDQYSTDPQGGDFFLRIEFAADNDALRVIGARFGAAIAERFAMEWRLWASSERKRIAVLVS